MTAARRNGPIWLGAALIGVLFAMTAWDIVGGYRDTVTETNRQLEMQARIIAEQTARSVQAVDVMLRHIAQQHRQGALDGLGPRELHNYLRDQQVGLVQIDGLIMIGGDGRFRASSRSFPLPMPLQDFNGRPAFEAVRNSRSGGGMLIETAALTPELKIWVFPMARRLETAEGAFAGAIGARGRIDYYQQFYRDIELEPGTAVVLLHQNGTMLARYPEADSLLGKPIALFSERLEAAKAGRPFPVRNKSPVDGIERFGAMRLVQGYPLAVVVTREVRTALAPWRAESLTTALRTFALGALAALLLWLLRRQLVRLDEASRSLRISQERFELAVAGSDDGIFVFDFAAGTAFSSARGRELSGLPPRPETQSLDSWFAEIPIHPEDAPRRLAAMQAHLEGKAPAYDGEFRLRQLDGAYRWIHIHGVCSRDSDGKPLRMAGSISDIDDRRKAEEALRESQERFALAVAGSNDGIIDWDLVHDRMYASERAMEIVGVDSKVTVRPRAEWSALIDYHPDDAARMKDDLNAFLDGRTEMRDGEYRVKLRDGSYRWIRHRNRCVRDGAGRPLRVAGSVSDIDAQKRAEEALRTSEEHYRAIFNASADALVLRDPDAKVVDVNPAFLELTGLTRAEITDGIRWFFALPEAVPRAKEMHRRVIAGESVRYEIRTGRRDGSVIDIEIRAVPIQFRGRTHSFAMARDITERKRAEAERERLESRLLQAKKLEAIGTLAGGIAHDFNNILSAILGYGEMAQKGTQPGSALKRHVDAIMAAGLRAKSLVERILAFSRSGIGERAPVRVQPVVAEALELARASLPAHVKLASALNTGNAALLGDPTQIHQVVMNLCANAAQAMKAAGTLSVTLDVVERPESIAATSALAAGRYIRLAVSDTGAGIPEAIRERIFDPFFTTREVGVGTGLGLSLVHGIVTDLGGGIDVQSHEGEGTTFTVYLPECDAGAADAASARAEALPGGAGETILFVDDEEALVQLGEEMIAALGYEPVGFTSSAAALEAFRAEPERFAAVLSDESMPGMTGSELARAIRGLRADVPIVLMTGFVTPALTARAGELGIAEVLAKPLVSRDIARALAAALHVHA
jgi:PAS domain S-box-containing protein